MKKIKEKDQRKDGTDKFKQNTNKRKNKLIALLVIAGIVTGISYVSYRSDNASLSSAAAVIDGIQCNTNEYVAQHIHAHLDIFANGQPYQIPAGIGIVDNTCLYWLHTHKTNGVIHIESPKSQEFTLGQFIDIWRSTGKVNLPSDSPKMFVNGLKVDTDLKNLNLNAHDEIVLVYGPMPPTIPSFYQFDQGE